MLSVALGSLTARLGRWARPRMGAVPWSSGAGLARTILALGTLGTLLATPSDVLLSPLVGGVQPPLCEGVAGASLWCVAPHERPELARWISIGVLAVVASGWRPRLTAVPHWWISWSFVASVTVQDGGDQITAVLTLALLPLTLTDPRRWHWQRLPSASGPGPAARVAAYAALLLIQLQMAGLYFQASIAKLSVQEWADGTALYYWFTNVIFGAPGYLHPLTSFVSSSGLLVALATWGSLALEFALAIAIFLGPRTKALLLAAGLLFHDAIALTMGLVSFDAAMTGGLLLYLLPVGCQLRRPRWLAIVHRVPRLGGAAVAGPTRAAVLEPAPPARAPVPAPALPAPFVEEGHGHGD